MAGSFGRGALRSGAPTLAGAFLGGAASSAAAGLEFGPIGVAAAGLGGGILGMIGASEAQKKLADVINPSESNPFSSASELRDVQTNPFSSEAGGLLLFKPNPKNVLNAVRSIGTKEGRQLFAQGYQLQKAIQAAPEAERAALMASPEARQALDAFHQTINVAGNTGVGAGMAVAQGQDPEHILLAAAQGSLFNDSWLHGKGGHPLDKPQDAQVHAELDKVAETDRDFANKTQTAAEVINQGAQNPLTSHAAEAAAEVLGETLPKEEAKQTQEIAEALKPVAEAEAKPAETFTAPEAETQTPTEQPTNASQIESPTALGEQPSGPESVRESGSEGVGQSDQGQEAARTGQEKIVAATYQNENGVIHEGANHIEAAAKAGVEAPNARKDRETPEYGFMVEDQNGNRRNVSRKEALDLATANGQLREGAKVARKRLHSDQVNMGDLPPKPSEPPPETIRITDYNKRGNLAEELELPHEEAIAKLEPRRNALELLLNCLNK